MSEQDQQETKRVFIPLDQIGWRECETPGMIEVGILWLDKLLVFELPKEAQDRATEKGGLELVVPKEDIS